MNILQERQQRLVLNTQNANLRADSPISVFKNTSLLTSLDLLLPDLSVSSPGVSNYSTAEHSAGNAQAPILQSRPSPFTQRASPAGSFIILLPQTSVSLPKRQKESQTPELSGIIRGIAIGCDGRFSAGLRVVPILAALLIDSSSRTEFSPTETKAVSCFHSSQIISHARFPTITLH